MTREEMESRVARIRQELEEAAAGRYPVPKLIAVTKTHSAEEILPLADMGITDIGENRVQELLTKLPELQMWARGYHCCALDLPRNHDHRNGIEPCPHHTSQCIRPSWPCSDAHDTWHP